MQALEEDPLAESDRWCAGLPYVGVRSMMPDERQAVTAIARGLLRSWWGILGILAALVLLPFALEGYRAPDIGPMASIVASAVAVLGFFASIVALVWRAHALWRARAPLLADITDGTVLEFAGTVSVTPGADADLAALVTAGVLQPGWTGDQRIAVLAVSRSVVYQDRRGSWQALRVRVRAVAAAPTYAMRAPVPHGIAVVTDPDKELVQRSLSAAEREEIRQYIRHVWRASWRRLFWLIPYSAIGVMLLLGWIRSGEHRLLGLVAPALIIFFIVRFVRRFAPALRRSTLLSRDLASGQVMTVQSRHHNEIGVGEIASPGAPAQEFLLRSRMVWTEGGRPASWRDLVSWNRQTHPTRSRFFKALRQL